MYRNGLTATIGRNRAIVEIGKRRFGGRLAWFVWLTVHIYYLTSFKNRLFVVLTWAWSYLVVPDKSSADWVVAICVNLLSSVRGSADAAGGAI